MKITSILVKPKLNFSSALGSVAYFPPSTYVVEDQNPTNVKDVISLIAAATMCMYKLPDKRLELPYITTWSNKLQSIVNITQARDPTHFPKPFSILFQY